MTPIIATTFYLFTLFFSYSYTFSFWKLRGKSYEELTPNQKSQVYKALSREYSWRRNKYTPETYLPRLQKLAVFTLFIAILYTILGISLLAYIYFLY
jgi:polyferredoxin